jgi:hypothetical protein
MFRRADEMAKKQTPKAIQEKKLLMAIRLELPIADYHRLEQQARQLGLTRASYARMAVLQRVRADEVKASNGH